VTHRQQTHSVKVGNVAVGGGAPIVIQSMTNTDTADVASTVQQCLELASAGSEMVRVTATSTEASGECASTKALTARIESAIETRGSGDADDRGTVGARYSNDNDNSGKRSRE
jgi:4-hydroxy-3-methylbut-2-en-1-yl diphosphate synthase IspG/GcpE